MLKVVTTNDAPAAIGPYVQAIICGNLVYLSGQLPLDPKTGVIVSESVGEQTDICLKNAKAILEEAGSSLEKVIKTTVFLSNMENFGTVNEIYSKYFSSHKPARACIEVSKLPKNAKVEIEMIASLQR